jgi:hypothetical protein
MFEYKTRLYYDNGLKIKVEQELFDYYFWHILKGTNQTLALCKPLYGSHISVTLPNIHGCETVESSKKYAGEEVTIKYSGEIFQGGSWFVNYWLPMYCERAGEIKDELGIVEDNFLGFHLTICSNKADMSPNKKMYNALKNIVDNRLEYFNDSQYGKAELKDLMAYMRTLKKQPL